MVNESAAKTLLAEALAEKGLELYIAGCGCCGSPWIELKKDGVLIFEGDNFKLGDYV